MLGQEQGVEMAYPEDALREDSGRRPSKGNRIASLPVAHTVKLTKSTAMSCAPRPAITLVTKEKKRMLATEVRR